MNPGRLHNSKPNKSVDVIARLSTIVSLIAIIIALFAISISAYSIHSSIETSNKIEIIYQKQLQIMNTLIEKVDNVNTTLNSVISLNDKNLLKINKQLMNINDGDTK